MTKLPIIILAKSENLTIRGQSDSVVFTSSDVDDLFVGQITNHFFRSCRITSLTDAELPIIVQAKSVQSWFTTHDHKCAVLSDEYVRHFLEPDGLDSQALLLTPTSI